MAILVKDMDENKIEALKAHYLEILKLLGENPDREGLLKTPERVAKAMLTLTRGYDMDPSEILKSARFREEYSQMVIVKDINFYSLCEHHMLPFYGKVHVAYIPNGIITGLSKIARVVDVFFSSFASAGEDDSADKKLYTRSVESFGSNGRGRSETYVYADAWG